MNRTTESANLRYGMSAYIGFCCSYSGLTDFIDTIPRLLYTKPTSKSQTNNSYDYETFVIVIILTTFLSADPKPDICEALAAVADEPVAWVIGGGDVYRQFLPYCVEAEVTHNYCVHPVDTYFPNLDADPAWKIARASGSAVVAAGEGDEGLKYEFVTYRRVDA